MGEMRLGYGSEFHLLRLLGRHRAFLSRQVAAAIGSVLEIEWFDFPFSIDQKTYYDREYTNLDFLSNIGLDPNVENKRYHEYWPSTGTPQNWDLTGRTADGRIVIVEAKGHVGEIKQTTGAGEKSMEKIQAAFNLIRERLGIYTFNDWTKEYYQLANRIFTCWYLNRVRELPCVIVNIYFTGDCRPDNGICPVNSEGWDEAIGNAYSYLGISKEMPFIREHVASCFIDIFGRKIMDTQFLESPVM